MKSKQVMVVGHRGARGLYPENTIPGFIEAVRLGVDALEMDVVVSKDKRLVVSHEAWMNPLFCSKPGGNAVEENVGGNYNLYKMLYAEIASFDCGKRGNPLFPTQKKIPAYKPLLSEVIREVEEFARQNGLLSPRYNIEIKSEEDNVFNPPPEEFTDLVYEEIKKSDCVNKVIIKSFDVRMLREMIKKDPSLKIALLVENNTGLDANLEHLGFIPEMYCPEYILVNDDLVKAVHDHHMVLVPWTVNEIGDIKNMIAMGVDGIITDYPDRVLEHLDLSEK
jgi:glycerophosphoryl diester phosphodiesterase